MVGEGGGGSLMVGEGGRGGRCGRSAAAQLSVATREQLFHHQATVAELLRHFWACFPILTPQLGEKVRLAMQLLFNIALTRLLSIYQPLPSLFLPSGTAHVLVPARLLRQTDSHRERLVSTRGRSRSSPADMHTHSPGQVPDMAESENQNIAAWEYRHLSCLCHPYS